MNNNTNLASVFKKAFKDLINDLPELEENKKCISVGSINEKNNLKIDYFLTMEFLPQDNNNRLKNR